MRIPVLIFLSCVIATGCVVRTSSESLHRQTDVTGHDSLATQFRFLADTPPSNSGASNLTLRLPLKDLKTMGGDCLIAMVQVENSGPVLGAAEYEVAANGS